MFEGMLGTRGMLWRISEGMLRVGGMLWGMFEGTLCKRGCVVEDVTRDAWHKERCCGGC